MRSVVRSVRRARAPRLVAAAAVLAGAAVAPLAVTPLPAAAVVGSSAPSSGTLGPTDSVVKTQFDPVMGADAGGLVASVNCTPGQCSQYALTVKLPQPDDTYYQSHHARLKFHCSWTSPQAQQKDDVDCLLFSPTGGQTGPGHPDTPNTGANFEDVIVNDPASGTWTVEVEGAATPAPTTVFGTMTLSLANNVVPPLHVPKAGDAAFSNFDFTDPQPNQSYQQGKDALTRPDAGEPSLGVDPATGKVLYMAGNQVTRITYDNARPPRPTLEDVTPPNSRVNEDAILFTDRQTHRTWALGLLLAGSYLAYTDDDGSTWTPSVAVSVPAMPDHETLGAGPYSTHAPLPSMTTPFPHYQHAVYYCAQAEVEAYCGRSDDGGMTFNSPAAALWNGACTAIHGHVRVGPTGIVYVPNSSCTDANNLPRSGLAYSLDDGQTFHVSVVPDSSPGTSDPSVMEGPDGTVYFGYQADDGHPMIATGHVDKAGNLDWNPSVDVGQMRNPGDTEDGLPFGVQNTEFSEVVTGDPGRAAFAFVGTGRQGAYQDGAFTGTWYLFVSYTFDGGQTWRTVNATPHDPVQRGCVWNGGLENACRNMLDFNDIGIDKQGHVYVAYTDGCTTTPAYSCDRTPGVHGWNADNQGDVVNGCKPSETDPPVTSTSTCTFARVSAIVRQVCGRGLVAAYDPGFDEAAGCAVTASSGGTTAVSSSVSGGVHAISAALPNTAAGAPAPWLPPVAGVALLGAGVGLSRRRRRA